MLGLVSSGIPFDDAGAELLDGKSANAVRKLMDHLITEAVIVGVQGVLDDPFNVDRTRFQQAEIERGHIATVWTLNEGESAEGDLVNELYALAILRVVNITSQT